jgi:hypothetical protein
MPVRSRPADREAALEAVSDLHAEVDVRVCKLAARHADRLRCGPGCVDCCDDDLTVFEVEAERIRRRHGALLLEGAPHRPGACAFLDARGSCRIYPHRPYVCRTQGLPLRWFDPADAEPGLDRVRVVERRDVCPLNLEGPALEGLDPDDCWLLGPTEERLGVIEERFSGGERRRVALRRLFRMAGPG